ncbi:MAG TPA: flagellar biosynthesis protein FliQ [Candidatus Limenecus avicola]|uniref:Flagellar biosynthetic protein FliQ n=1 Tax=Candidatus Limenecus avicola TaxID=2840847 RepID=A0A9D1SR30_9CLOT|nr:flagellar biosynthesis protein FliQ [Candidatus Limenecus avicola]
MEDTVFLTLTQNVLILILMLSTPILIVSMVVGLLISVFQAVTQIQEATLTFVPKIIAGILTMIILLPWMLNTFIARCTEMFEYVQTMIK